MSDSVTSLARAFCYECLELEKVQLSKNIEILFLYTFVDCYKLRYVEYWGTTSPICESGSYTAFTNTHIPEITVLCVLDSKGDNESFVTVKLCCFEGVGIIRPFVAAVVGDHACVGIGHPCVCLHKLAFLYFKIVAIVNVFPVPPEICREAEILSADHFSCFVIGDFYIVEFGGGVPRAYADSAAEGRLSDFCSVK